MIVNVIKLIRSFPLRLGIKILLLVTFLGSFTYNDSDSNQTLSEPLKPFDSSTLIEYEVPHSGYANLSIFNIQGKLVTTLVDGKVAKGTHVISWNGDTNKERKINSKGIYICKLSFDGISITNKIFLK